MAYLNIPLNYCVNSLCCKSVHPSLFLNIMKVVFIHNFIPLSKFQYYFSGQLFVFTISFKFSEHPCASSTTEINNRANCIHNFQYRITHQHSI